MFFLTRREQTMILITVTALLIGAGLRHHRLEGMLPEGAAAEGKHLPSTR